MMYSGYLSITLLVWITLITGGAGQGAISIDIYPAEKVHPGTTVTISCVLNRQTTSYDLLWLRRQGSMTSKLASGDVLDRYVDNGRYELEMTPRSSRENYTLTIRSVAFEDTSTIECSLENGQEWKRKPLVVCDHLKSKSCDCMHTEGFNYPGCFDEPDTVEETKDQYRGTIIGLAVCFVIVVIYAVLVTILLSRDCATKLYARRQKLLQKVRKPKANGRAPQRAAYQQAEELEIDPSEAPNWGPGRPGQGGGSNHHTETQQTHLNPAYEDDTNGQVEIRTPAIHPDARPRNEYDDRAHPAARYQDYGASRADYPHGRNPSPRTTAVVEHHPEPVAPPLSNSNSYQYGSKPGYSAIATPSPGTYPALNGYLPDDVTKQRQPPATPTPRGTYPSLSPPSTPYDAQKSPGGISTVSGNITPRSAYSERTSHSPKWNAQVPERGAYTDIPRDKGQSWNQGAGGKRHQREPRKLEFTGSGANNNNENQSYINKSDTVV